jgi:hypothetical protein
MLGFRRSEATLESGVSIDPVSTQFSTLPLWAGKTRKADSNATLVRGKLHSTSTKAKEPRNRLVNPWEGGGAEV